MNTSNLSLTKPGTAQSFCLPVVLLHPGEKVAVVHGTATATEIDTWYGLTEGLSDSTIHWVFQDEFVAEVDATVRLVLSENGIALTVDEAADFSGELFRDVIVERSARRKGLLTFSGSVLRGPTLYELKDHLGNVTVVVSDRKLARDANGNVAEPVAYHAAQVRSARDFYPFGMAMPGRRFDTPAYRYGFQGQEGDDEWLGDGNAISYKYRVTDSRLGRFFSIDPLAPDYPWNSPYAFSENRVSDAVELEGLESVPIHPYYGLNNIGYAFQGFLQQSGKEIDNLGANISAFFGFGTEETGTSNGTVASVTNETRGSISFGTQFEKWFTPNGNNRPLVGTPIKMELKMESQLKVTIKGTVSVEGMDFTLKNVLLTSSNEETVENNTTVIVGKGESGLFIKVGSNGEIKGGVKAEHKVSAGGNFIKLGAEITVGGE